MLDEFGKKLISGVRSLDNCYGLVPDADIVCNIILLPNKDLWHQKMGHASYKHLSIISKHESMLGIPKNSRVSNVVMWIVSAWEIDESKTSKDSNISYI